MRLSRTAPSNGSPVARKGLLAGAALLLAATLALPLSGCEGPFSDDAPSAPAGTSGQSHAGDGATPAEQEVDPNAVISTPPSRWRKGEAPYLYQIDPQYANAVYSGGSFAKQGCGPTSLAVAYIDLTGNTDKGPLEMAQFATDNGYSTDQNGSTWTLISEGAEKLGLQSSELDGTPEQITEALEGGNLVICVMAPGTFTQVGHFITLVGLDEDGKAIVRDSNSVERSHQTWDLDLICEEAEALWSVRAAD